ncbi:MAG: hypothetical protein RL268_94 [Pseudomonadota bacterium]
MTWTETFDQVAGHYARLAMTPGWWQYARQQVTCMEQDPDHGQHWQGLREAVGQRIKAAGYRPHPDEMREWWIAPAVLPVSPRWRGR